MKLESEATRLYLFFLYIVVILLVGCDRGAQRVVYYEEAKKTNPTQSSEASDQHATSDLVWTVPPGWKEKPATSMRVASFSVPGDLDGSIVELAGDGGGVLANLNRWRGQLGLAPINAEEASKQETRDKGAEGIFSWYVFVNPKGEAMLAAIIPTQTKTVFVKLSGAAQGFQAQSRNFLLLAKSIHRGKK